MLKVRKHLFNGSIFDEGGIYVVKDSSDKFITYGKTLDHAKMEVFNFLKKLFSATPFLIEYKNKTGYCDFAAYKRGRYGR